MSLESIKITVIIPSYNPKAYIWECLDSIKNQTFNKKEFEVIIVLNGCNEPFYGQIRNYIDTNLTDNIIRFVQTNQGGVSNARNIGLNIAKGEYITFIDDDDYVSPEYLDELYNTRGQNAVPISNIIAFTDGVNNSQPYYLTDAYNKNANKGARHILQVRSYMSIPCCKLLDSNTIAHRRFNTRFKNGEDGLFMFLLSDKITKLICTNPNAIYYRRYREGQAVKNDNRIYLFSNNIKLAFMYCIYYFKKPLKYNFLFFASRICACVNNIFASN